MESMGYWSRRISSKSPTYSFTLPQDRVPFTTPDADLDFNPQPYVTAWRDAVGTFSGKPCFKVSYGKEQMVLCPDLMLTMEVDQ
jgi:hypothetical protein